MTNSAMKGQEALTREQRLEAALAELVRLEELKGRLHFTMNELPHGSFGSRRKFLAAEEDYCTNRPLAWEAARQALASLTPPQQNDVADLLDAIIEKVVVDSPHEPVSAEQMREMVLRACLAVETEALRADQPKIAWGATKCIDAIRSLPLSGQPEEQRSVHSDGDTA